MFLLPLLSARQVDDLVGAVVATLETERLIDSTYIFYSSDQCASLSSYACSLVVPDVLVPLPVLMLALAVR